MIQPSAGTPVSSEDGKAVFLDFQAYIAAKLAPDETKDDPFGTLWQEAAAERLAQEFKREKNRQRDRGKRARKKVRTSASADT